MTPEQASALRIAIHRLVRAERQHAILNTGSRAHIRRLMADVNQLLKAAIPEE